MQKEYFDLLKIWCDRLLELQMNMRETEINGGLICPACHIIHGRCGDAIYPLITLADITGENKYLEAAKKLFDWTENNLSKPDGSVINDRLNLWKGISVFYSMSLMEALIYHGKVLDSETYEKWENRVKKLLDFLIPNIEKMSAAINYKASMCASLALAYKLFGDEYYIKEADRYADMVIPYINKEYMLTGEPRPIRAASPKGRNTIDLGYNAEESLPALAIYSKISGNKKVEDITNKTLTELLNFYLPDGGLDNSFGSRIPKWTYWGSRTSDGCQTGFAAAANTDPRFAEAAQRNFELLRECTDGGLLHGGPMYVSAGEPACIHHTFCHAKSLAALIDTGFCIDKRSVLPFDRGDKVIHYNSLGVSLIRKGKFRGTIANTDFESFAGNYRSNACLTLLRHDDAGMIFAATMPQYGLPEITNMQYSVKTDSLCGTPRISIGEYTNIYDLSADIDVSNDGFTQTVKGVLRDREQNGVQKFRITYNFNEDAFVSEYLCDADSVLDLPIISKGSEAVDVSENSVVIHRDNCLLEICSDSKIFCEKKERNFNPVGGFQTLLTHIELKKDCPCTVKVIVK